MRVPAAAALAALSLVPSTIALAQSRPPVPSIETLAAYPKMSGFSVSPDGRHLAALEGRGEDRVILVWRTDDLAMPPTVVGSKVMKIRGVSFVKNDTLAVALWQPYDLRFDKTTKTFANKLFFTDLQGRQWREPLELPRPRSDTEELEQSISEPTILDELPNDPDHVLVVNNVGVTQGDIYKVNVRDGRSERVQRAAENTFAYTTDLEGVLRARSRIDTSSEGGSYIATELRNPGTGAWEEHFRSFAKARDISSVVGFAKDPNVAYVLSNAGRDKAAIYEYDVRAKKLGAIAFEHRFFDATGVAVSPYKANNFGELWGFSYAGPTGNEVYYAAPWLAALDKQVAGALGVQESPQVLVDPATGEKATSSMRTGRAIRFASVSQDLNVMVVEVESPSEPASYYLLRNRRDLSLISRTYPDINPAAMGDSRLVYYKARDGLDIPAFLHTPDTALCGAGPWPTVIHPHGGPWARDYLGFDYSMWVPLLVSRCRAVLQPQYRGTSDGWGRRLWVAGDAEWGQKMQDDKDDGAKWLIEQKIAIPGRIAMFGFSYGGYAAFAAAVRPNGLYKCAIAGAGVSDIERIWARFYRNVYFRDRQAPTVKGLIPLEHADKIQIPIYVYHGERDQIVPIRQSEWFVQKAKAAGKDVVYREFKDYAHGPAWTRQVFGEQLRAIDDYLAKGCGGGL
jgi:acetyl esterase/lipase